MGWNATKLPKSLERVDIPGDFLNLIVETNTVGFSPDQVGIINLSYDEGWEDGDMDCVDTSELKFLLWHMREVCGNEADYREAVEWVEGFRENYPDG